MRRSLLARAAAALAALAALGAVHPADLPARLKPLLDKDTPHGLREIAKAALSAPRQCR